MSNSPFHLGERMIQLRTGRSDDLERLGRAAIGGRLSDDQAAQLARLNAVVLGSLDVDGTPRCDPLVGDEGLVTVLSPTRLRLQRAEDGCGFEPPPQALGSAIGLLALDGGWNGALRIAGYVAEADRTGITVEVLQVFSMSAQLLHQRERAPRKMMDPVYLKEASSWRSSLDGVMTSLVDEVDTLFIASRHPELDGSPEKNVDVSCRGGLPGFVLAPDDKTLLWPEYERDGCFSTLGNLVLDPRCGLTLTASGRSGAIQIAGRAQILWRDAEAKRLTGCDRAVRLTIDKARPTVDRYGLVWPVRRFSSGLAGLPRAPEAALRARVLRIDNKVDEAQDIVSLFLSEADGRPSWPFVAGQHVDLRVPDGTRRKYTISTYGPSPASYRITVQRHSGEAGAAGRVSSYLHDEAKTGDLVQVVGPQGRFNLPRELHRPLVLLSAGIGITPMMAMAEELALRAPVHPLWFLHGTRHGGTFAFSGRIRALRRELRGARWHIRFSQPRSCDRLGVDYDKAGRLETDVLRSLLRLDSYDFYVCGPDEFVQAL